MTDLHERLREDLARHLAESLFGEFNEDMAKITGWAKVPIIIRTYFDDDAERLPEPTFGDLADECIRQMEWAQRQQMAYLDVAPVRCGTEGCGCEIGVAPLTLAPPDWSPNG